MSIRLEIDGQAVVEFEEENILLGSDPACTVPFLPATGLAPKHAVIRKIAGRWIVEVRGGDSIQVGDAEPTRMHWLNPGDIIRLTDAGPSVQFEPPQRATKPAARRSSAEIPVQPKSARRSSAEIPVQPKPATRPKSETIDSFQLSKPKSISMPTFDQAVELDTVKSKPQPKSTPSVEPVEFNEAPTPEMRPLPALGKSSPWLGTAATAASTGPRDRARRRLWMQVGGAAVLAIAVIVFLISGRNPSRTRPDSTPSTDSTTASTRAPNVPIPQASPSVPREKTTPEGPVKESETKPDSIASKPVDPATQSLVTIPTPPSKSTPKPPSATLVAVRDGVYTVFAKLPEREVYYRLGTAWAASKRHLVTSGAVAVAVEGLKSEGASIVVSQPFQERPIVIKGARMHSAYSTAVQRAAAAKARMADESSTPAKGADDQEDTPAAEFAKALATQARFDLGVLDIEAGQRLPTFLKMQTGDMADVSKADFLLVGFPFAENQSQTEGVHKTGDVKERVSTRNSAVKNESDLSLTMKFTGEVADEIWSGSPVFDRSQRVIGVYSRPAMPAQENESVQKRRHAIIWLGRLREFASDLE
ncbi:MAG: hypothetical protein JWP89_5173 [Schlesneria sp.]|nr:hypothetical protein [Schlesneria sp.]